MVRQAGAVITPHTLCKSAVLGGARGGWFLVGPWTVAYATGFQFPGITTSVRVVAYIHTYGTQPSDGGPRGFF